MTEPRLSIVIPVYNEERNVGEAMRRIQAFLSLKGSAWECLIVSDGSTDNTNTIVEKHLGSADYTNFRLLTVPENRGKGAAVRRGMLEAAGKFILITDVDLSSPIKESDKLIRYLEEGYDVAIGSRALRAPGCDVRQSFKRRLSGRIFNLIVWVIALKGFHDTQCGFKCFKKEAAKKLFGLQKLDGFSFDVEVLCLAQKLGLRVKEVPVMWSQGRDSKIKLFKDSFVMVKDLFRLRQSVKMALMDVKNRRFSKEDVE